MKYVLITFYNRQTDQHPSWEVYGHVKPYINDFLGGFHTREEAIMEAFKFGVPVMQGTNLYHIVEKLCLD